MYTHSQFLITSPHVIFFIIAAMGTEHTVAREQFHTGEHDRDQTYGEHGTEYEFRETRPEMGSHPGRTHRGERPADGDVGSGHEASDNQLEYREFRFICSGIRRESNKGWWCIKRHFQPSFSCRWSKMSLKPI